NVMSTVTAERRIDVVIDSKELAADGVAVLTLRQPDRGVLPAWTAGAHIDLSLPNAVTRQYSLCGDPTDRSNYPIAALREPKSRGGSAFVHQSLHVGQALGIGAPRNNFPLLRAANYLFIAGGIGITPILPMLSASHHGNTNWTLLYGGRQRGSM